MVHLLHNTVYLGTCSQKKALSGRLWYPGPRIKVQPGVPFMVSVPRFLLVPEVVQGAPGYIRDPAQVSTSWCSGTHVNGQLGEIQPSQGSLAATKI